MNRKSSRHKYKHLNTLSTFDQELSFRVCLFVTSFLLSSFGYNFSIDVMGVRGLFSGGGQIFPGGGGKT